jgi:hypothetical protein
MSKVEKVKEFNEILENLLLQLSPKIGTSYHTFFKMYLKANAISPINNFWFFAEPLESKILSRDETYFTNPDNHVDVVREHDKENQVSLDEILRLKDVYEELDQKGKDGLWDFTLVLFTLAKEYNQLKIKK